MLERRIFTKNPIRFWGKRTKSTNILRDIFNNVYKMQLKCTFI